MKKIFLISLLLVTTNLFAQSAAVTLAATNKVIAKMKSTERNITRGSPLNTGDAVMTSSNSLATLKYTNGTIVDLGERSSYQILAYSPKQSDITIKAELYSGKLHSKTSGKLKETLKTPVVALSILGTEYNVFIANKSLVYVQVIQGRVSARGKVIHAGETYAITPTKMYKTTFPARGYVTPAFSVSQGGSGGTGAGTSGGSTAPVAKANTTLARKACAANDPNCSNDEGCEVNLMTKDSIDVVDTYFMLGSSIPSVVGVIGLIS